MKFCCAALPQDEGTRCQRFSQRWGEKSVSRAWRCALIKLQTNFTEPSMSLLERRPSCDPASVPEIRLSRLDSLSSPSQDTPEAGGRQMVRQLLGPTEKWIIIYTSGNLILKALTVLGSVTDCWPAAPDVCDGKRRWRNSFPLVDSTTQR